jgi:DNA-binding XRE family transcriptional regulator
MITNERQLANANRKLEGLQAARDAVDAEDAVVYDDLIQEVTKEVERYLAVRDGLVNLFGVDSLDDLGPALVMARVSRGWSQRQLASELGVSEQMVQKIEAKHYENAGLAKVAETIDALGYELVGSLRPKYLPRDKWRIDDSILFGAPMAVGGFTATGTAVDTTTTAQWVVTRSVLGTCLGVPALLEGTSSWETFGLFDGSPSPYRKWSHPASVAAHEVSR